PDHTHAVAAIMAMKMGKHCYCEKPLTHSIYEARQMREVAAKHKVATQMGNQGTSTDGLRRGAEIIRSGALGPVSEVHIWTTQPPERADSAAEHRPAAAGPGDPRGPELGRVARPGPVAALPQRLRAVRLARLVGLRHRRPGRHGLPHDEPAVHGPAAGRADRGV